MTDDNRCHDCGVAVGEPHEDGCDVARCLWTGEQRLQCTGDLARECCQALVKADRFDLAERLSYYLGLDDPDHECGQDIWTGQWPGDAECREFGWYSYFGPEAVPPQRGWVRCGPDHPGATADLNRLAVEARWDREQQRWVKR